MRLRLLAAKLSLTRRDEDGTLFTSLGNGQACRDEQWSSFALYGQRSRQESSGVALNAGVTRLTWQKFVPGFAKREQRRLLMAQKCHSCTVHPHERTAALRATQRNTKISAAALICWGGWRHMGVEGGGAYFMFKRVSLFCKHVRRSLLRGNSQWLHSAFQCKHSSSEQWLQRN